MAGLVVIGLTSLMGVLPVDMAHRRVILDFAEVDRGYPVNDSVMGGVSWSRFDRTATAFTGFLSLENNGGFASVRFVNPDPDLSGVRSLVLTHRGDGRTYQLRLRHDRQLDGVAWRAAFPTEQGIWSETEIPLDAFVPTLRGRTLRGVAPLRLDRVLQITVMLADKQPGEFSVELGKLYALE
jgi:monofunctional biosynthetic peptidoglycan transglycosylase